MAESAKSSSALDKAFRVLLALRRASSGMTMTALAEEAGLPVSSAHSILNQLLEQGAVVQSSDKRYRLGPVMLYLGASVAYNSPIYRTAWFELVNAANEYSVSATMAVPWDSYHLVLNSHRSTSFDVTVPHGGRVPLDSGSWGKVYYATSGAPLPETLNRYTAHTITDLAEYKEAVEETRQRGYATDNEEYHEGVGAVCAAVTSESGYEGLVCFLAPKAQIEEVTFERLGGVIAGLAARASLALGDSARLARFGTE